jgi:hypothetical protein
MTAICDAYGQANCRAYRTAFCDAYGQAHCRAYKTAVCDACGRAFIATCFRIFRLTYVIQRIVGTLDKYE